MDYNLDIKEEPLDELDPNAVINSLSNDIDNEEGIVKEENKILSIENEFNEEIEETIEEMECTICQRLFECEKFLKAHIKTHIASEKIDKNLKEKFLKCEKYSESFDTENELKSPILLHEDTTANSEVYVDKEDLIQKEIQLSKDYNVKPYKCDKCPKSFSLKFFLNRHKHVHTDTKLPTCEICLKTFTTAGNLLVHMRRHTGEQPFHCKVCKKSFSQQHGLTIHLHTHTGERPFKCEVCSKGFIQRYDLKKHMRIHTGELPFTCEICTKGFKTRRELKVHMRTHINKKLRLQTEFKKS